jgi:hypothetical protein
VNATEKEERKQRWIRLLEAGYTLQAIANSEGLSRERVRQVVGPNTPRSTGWRAKELKAWYEANPDLDAFTLSHAAGYTQPQYKKLRAMGWKKPEAPHGSQARYQQELREGKGTCDVCKKASRERHREYVLSVRAKGIPTEKHGTNDGYQTYGCRCVPCKAANSERQRENARKRKLKKETHGTNG